MPRDARVAIIGAGPSGFFTAAALLAEEDPRVSVDMYDRLPTPWGLVRSGVAPDHPKIKSVSAVFEKTAAHDRFEFFGYVELGRQVTRQDLLERYDAVVYATGAQQDNRLGIPGEDLVGSVPASRFVGWYNGHPDHDRHEFDLSTETAVVVGNGNVALDIARILVTPVDDLVGTDIADHAVEALRSSSIREVYIIGRRGPAQAAFTTAELRELESMAGARVVVEPPGLSLDETSEDARVSRNLTVLAGFRAKDWDAEPARDKTVVLRFLASPVELLGSAAVEGIVLAHNRLIEQDGRVTAVDSGERSTLRTSLVVSAVGYHSEPLAGVPFDDRLGRIPHDDGRVRGSDREYVVGWSKRGPSGVIGANKKCASETVHSLLADLRERIGADDVSSSQPTVEWLRVRHPELVVLEGWQAIDEAERAAGEAAGRPRIKHCSFDELLRVAASTGGRGGVGGTPPLGGEKAS